MKKYLILGLVFSPLLASAQLEKTTKLVNNGGNIIGMLVGIVGALALLVFFWGLVKFITKAGEEKAEGKSIMIWGVVALFVMVSIWGIIGFIQADVLGTAPATNQQLPCFTPSGNTYVPC